MTAEESLVARLNATSGVTALVASRIYPMEIPQGAVMPAIAYQRISTFRPGSLRGPVGLADPRIQVDCWADTYAVAKAVAQAVRQSLDGYASDGVAAIILGEHDLVNPDGLRKCVTQDFSFWVTE
jgi:hypothetical protein